MISEKPNYWEILGVDQGASNEELQAAYRRLALKHHPDKNKGNEEAATERFQEVQRAFDALKDLEKRSAQSGSRDAPCPAKATAAPSAHAGAENPFAWFDHNWGPSFGRSWNETDRRRDVWSKGKTTEWFEEKSRNPLSSGFTTQQPGFGVFSRLFTRLPPLPPFELRLQHHQRSCDWRESRRIISIRVFS
ncbi:DnaJ domain-containing protein [Nemania abortiva]|nr:DnaJ domain-containing protein [Nemania abortiva]